MKQVLNKLQILDIKSAKLGTDEKGNVIALPQTTTQTNSTPKLIDMSDNPKANLDIKNPLNIITGENLKYVALNLPAGLSKNIKIINGTKLDAKLAIWGNEIIKGNFLLQNSSEKGDRELTIPAGKYVEFIKIKNGKFFINKS
ncbi:hypothetical protein [Tenacibaculum maritimum]|uniref:hypothetical protein n=1 Tax=Tenacibaculum maritimum TaxID=107401 RepID=UPI0004248435|nr:hypothetical protein [Tenacibaculum maritimum]MDB0599649.1 hypothetical protein [Tenacibaculum maritimum]MDB0599778.1 hypothetical protein [Tenacibaculum maritimum]MDB0599998.1 hypothetical protein [Tenacibaculum maritimum]MDB0600129.1 hypothetical protein [Tenacibaculum maritimum]MDB0600679.1 hypothetical protein [Tenacibaculum maritimum]